MRTSMRFFPSRRVSLSDVRPVGLTTEIQIPDTPTQFKVL